MSTSTADVERLAYKAETAAEVLDCSKGYVYKLIGNGTLRTVKIGRSRRIPHTELLRLIEEGA